MENYALLMVQRPSGGGGTFLYLHLQQFGTVRRHGEAGPGPKGSAMSVEFQLEGEDFIALNGGPCAMDPSY